METVPHETDARWVRDGRAAPEAVAAVRHGISQFAAKLGASDECVADVGLAVTEAATNVVVHAYADHEEMGRLWASAEPIRDGLLVRVIDEGRGMAPRPDSPGLRMGLPLIGNLCSSFDIREGPGGRGTEVRMTFLIPGVLGPSAVDDVPSGYVELLTNVTRLAESGGWPDEGVGRLTSLLVPQVADVCTVDAVDDDGMATRLAARVADSEEDSAWLQGVHPPVDKAGSATNQVVRTRKPAISECTSPAPGSLAERLQVRWWITMPLHEGEQLLGLLGFGLRDERGQPDPDRLQLFELIAERAARGLAQRALMDELLRTRRRLQNILGALAEAITVTDETGRIVYANEAAARLLGEPSAESVMSRKPGELAAKFTMTHEDGRPVAVEDLPGRRLFAGKDAPPLLTHSVHRETGVARWMVTKATLLEDGSRLAVNIIEDVTEAKENELRQRFLIEAGLKLGASLDYEETLAAVAALVTPRLADWCGIDVVDADGNLQRVALAHVDERKVRWGHELHRRYPPRVEDTSTGIGAVLAGGPAQLFPDIPDELLEQSIEDPEQLRLIREIGMKSVMLVPMRIDDRTIGVLTMVNAESGRAFTEKDLDFAEGLAKRAALAVETARRFGERR